jgi:PAS domain S-box-containing protein
MNDLSIDCLRKMDKDELQKQAFSLFMENETLRRRLAVLERNQVVSNRLAQPLSVEDKERERLIDKLASLVFTCNPRGDITYVNQACIDISGFSRAELLDKKLIDLVHDDNREQAMTRIMARFQQGSPEVNTFKIKKKDGSLVWLEIFGVTLEGSTGVREPFLLVNAVDVGKRVAADQALRKSESLFRGFADNIQAAIYLIRDNGEIVYANPFASKLSGYSNKELLGLPGFAIVHPDDREMAIARNQARLRGEKVPGQYDLRLQVKDAELKWVELHMERFELDGQLMTLGTAIDVTARKASEQALQYSEEKFKAFTENLQVLVYTYDSNGYFTYVNRMCEKLIGYSQEELLQMNFLEILREDYREISLERAAFRRAVTEGGGGYDVACVTKDGRDIWLELSGVRLSGDDAENIITLGNAVDITARVESEEALKESEVKFRNLFERSTDPMLLLDENGFFDCNSAAIKIMQAESKHDLLVHPAVISPELQPDGISSQVKARLKIEEAYASGACHFEWQHRDFTGHLFWNYVSLTVIPFKNRKILFTIWRDISEFKKLEQLLRDEREQLLVTLRSIGDAVITTDIDGRVVLMNRIAEHLTGWSQAEAAGQMINEILELVSGKTGEMVVNPLGRAVSGGMVLDLPSETVLLSRTGERFKIADSASPIRDEKSRIIGGVMVFRDISDRERLQEEVLKFKKLESVGRLAGGIAHDFNNLLTGIMGNLEVAGLRLARNPDQARENIEKSLKASRRAADLTQKLLTFAKGGEPIKKTADLGEIIRDSAEFVMSGSNIALDFEFAEDLWAAEVDTGQISQVIQNLVINAVQAMEEGGTIFIRAENFQFRTRKMFSMPLPFGAYIKISVKDQGHGIPSELIPKVFDPFFTTRLEGSGLGLSVTHSIVSKHGGHVSVSSKSGEFTEFTVFLPALHEQSLKSGRIPQMQSQKQLRGGRILIMDDEDLICEILSGFLEDQGHTVVTVHDGQQVLKEYQRQEFSLVILDLTIPGGMGGQETIKLLKEYDPDVKAIVSSGYANDPMMADCAKYGFCGCLNKPYILEDLLQLINRIHADSD